MKRIIILIVSILFGLIFLNAGLNKFLNYMPPPDDIPEEMMKIMAAYMQIGWLLPLIGIIEITGGILFMIPRTRALGALVIFPILVGILLTHLINEPSGLPLALALWTIEIWILIENREKYMHLIR